MTMARKDVKGCAIQDIDDRRRAAGAMSRAMRHLDIMDYRSQARTLSAVAGWGTDHQNLTGDGPPARLAVGLLTANTFDVLGLSPLLGRTFTEAEDQPNAAPVALLSYSLWRSRYGSDPGIIGRTIALNDVSTQVIGVMPERFRLPSDYTADVSDPTQLWRPMMPGSLPYRERHSE